MKIELLDAVNMLKSMNNVVILIHQFPDGDTIGCGYSLATALQSLGKKVRIECTHKVDKRYSYITDSVVMDEFEPEHIVSVDVAGLNLLGDDIKEKYGDKIELCIDHHPTNEMFAQYTFVDENAAAACEIIYQIIIALCGDINKLQANALYTGISTDTGCFKFTNTSARTHEIAAKLMSKGAEYGEINRIMFDTKSKSRIAIETKAMESIEYTCNGKVALMCITKKMREETGAKDSELEGVTGLPRQIEGVVLGITIRERDDTSICKISARSHEPVSASGFCANFGGGGHERAAGCTIKQPIGIVKEMLLKQAEISLQQAGLC